MNTILTDTSSSHAVAKVQNPPPDIEIPSALVPVPRSQIANSYLGIDNGLTGTMALLLPDDTVLFHCVDVRDLGKERLLDIRGNLRALREMMATATAISSKLLVVYEQSPITPQFGVKNNFVNGRNNEFWRVLLTLEQVPFAWVNPRRWQKDVFQGIRGAHTKEMARLVVEQRLPRFCLPRLTKSQTEGVMDAICIALWAREHHA